MNSITPQIKIQAPSPEIASSLTTPRKTYISVNITDSPIRVFGTKGNNCFHL